ncbi:MAG TPA: L-threonylcarbamoyladenylate synthase [Actinomycetota bacterium]|nr:L-threonylcarbamoyladenylate synthase [Actinomycetota bacterium]
MSSPPFVSLAADREAALEAAAKELDAGGVVVFPTDTVYGIGADAFNPEATRRVFEAKQRPRSMPLPVLVARPRQAWALCSDVPRSAQVLVAAFWPGPLTLILPEAEGLSWELGETRGGVAVRMPAHDDLLDLIMMIGPLAATSANVSGRPTPPTAEAVAAELGDTVSLYVDGGPASSDVPSTIVDLTRWRAKVTREGPISKQAIEEALLQGT